MDYLSELTKELVRSSNKSMKDNHPGTMDNVDILKAKIIKNSSDFQRLEE